MELLIGWPIRARLVAPAIFITKFCILIVKVILSNAKKVFVSSGQPRRWTRERMQERMIAHDRVCSHSMVVDVRLLRVAEKVNN